MRDFINTTKRLSYLTQEQALRLSKCLQPGDSGLISFENLRVFVAGKWPNAVAPKTDDGKKRGTYVVFEYGVREHRHSNTNNQNTNRYAQHARHDVDFMSPISQQVVRKFLIKAASRIAAGEHPTIEMAPEPVRHLFERFLEEIKRVHISTVTHVFVEMDTNMDNAVNKFEFRRGMQRALPHIQALDDTYDALFFIMDKDQSGHISLQEMSQGFKEEKFRESGRIDSGLISKKQLKRIRDAMRAESYTDKGEDFDHLIALYVVFERLKILTSSIASLKLGRTSLASLDKSLENQTNSMMTKTRTPTLEHRYAGRRQSYFNKAKGMKGRAYGYNLTVKGLVEEIRKSSKISHQAAMRLAKMMSNSNGFVDPDIFKKFLGGEWQPSGDILKSSPRHNKKNASDMPLPLHPKSFEAFSRHVEDARSRGQSVGFINAPPPIRAMGATFLKRLGRHWQLRSVKDLFVHCDTNRNDMCALHELGHGFESLGLVRSSVPNETRLFLSVFDASGNKTFRLPELKNAIRSILPPSVRSLLKAIRVALERDGSQDLPSFAKIKLNRDDDVDIMTKGDFAEIMQALDLNNVQGKQGAADLFKFFDFFDRDEIKCSDIEGVLIDGFLRH